MACQAVCYFKIRNFKERLNVMMINRNIAPLSTSFKNSGMAEAIWQRVDKIDFTNVSKKLMLEAPEQWTSESVKQAELLYRHFLVLHALHPNEDLVPTKQIDAFWHQHILDTRKYEQDCEYLFGSFLHHDPYFGINGKEDRRRNELAFEWTKVLWQSAFGVSLLGVANPCASTDCR